MCHEQRCARERLNRVFEHFERWNVEVIRRFVEDEDVGGLKHHARDVCTCELAARQHRNRLEQLLIAEEKSPRPTLDVHFRIAETNLLTKRRNCILKERALRKLRARLRHRDDARRRISDGDRAGIGREFAGQDAQEGCLARAVWAHQTDALAGHRFKIEVLEEQAATERLRDVRSSDEFACTTTGRGEIDTSVRGVGGSVSLGEFGEFSAALGTVRDASLALRAARFRAASEPTIIFAHGVRERLLRFRLHVEKLIATPTKLAVVSVDRERSFGIGAREFDDARGAVLEEDAIVRDENRRARAEIVAAAQQKLFHPAQAFDVEMVRRLVQEEEIWRAARGGERAGKRKPLFPAAGERFDRDVHARIIETDLAENHGCEHFRFVAISMAIGARERGVGCR